MAVDFKALSKNDQGSLIAGGVGLLFSFFTWFVSESINVSDEIKQAAKTAGVDVPSGHYGASAWHSYGTLGMLLVVVALAIVAIRIFAAGTLPDTVPWNLVTLAAAGLGTILVILRGITWPGSPSIGWSGIIVFVALIALTVFSFLNFKSSGEKIPEFNQKNDTPPTPPTPPAPPAA